MDFSIIPSCSREIVVGMMAQGLVDELCRSPMCAGMGAFGDSFHSSVPVGSLTSFHLLQCAVWLKMSHADEWVKVQIRTPP